MWKSTAWQDLDGKVWKIQKYVANYQGCKTKMVGESYSLCADLHKKRHTLRTRGESGVWFNQNNQTFVFLPNGSLADYCPF